MYGECAGEAESCGGALGVGGGDGGFRERQGTDARGKSETADKTSPKMGVNKNGVDGSFDGGVDKNEVFYRKKEERIKKGVKNVDRDSRNGGGLRVGGSGDSGDIGSCGDVRRDDERGFLDGYFCCCDSAGVGVGLGGARRAGAVATAKSLEKALKRRLII